MSHLSMWTVNTMASMYGNEARLVSLAENVMGTWNHLVLMTGPSTAT
jgi:hypothetical protein